jgi:hypothetical protein
MSNKDIFSLRKRLDKLQKEFSSNIKIVGGVV